MMFVLLAIVASCLALEKPSSSSSSQLPDPTSVYEFCAEGQVFSFSYAACPGGILFKNPVILNEPCHCVSEHLNIYSECESNGYTNPPTACRRRRVTGEENIQELVLLVQPFKSRTNESTLLDTSKDSSSCARTSCARHPRNTIVTRSALFDKHSPAKEIEPDYPTAIRFSPGGRSAVRSRVSRRRSKRELSEIVDKKLLEKVLETIDFLNELQFGNGTGTVGKQKSMAFQLLSRTVKIFNHISPSVIVEDETMNSILALFLKKYQKLETPSYSGKLTADEHIDQEVFQDVMARLHECASKGSDVSQEFQFLADPAECPANVTHVVDKVIRPDGSVKRRYLELGKVMPESRKYVPETEDFVLGVLWKAFDAVYAYCYDYLLAHHNAQALVYYFTFVESVFSAPWVKMDFLSSDGHGTTAYSSRIEHENLEVLMRNIDAMNEAVHMLGRHKYFFLKPVANEMSPPPEPAAPAEPSASRKRRKRSALPESSGWPDLEIWGGRAYCLQTMNPYVLPSIANAYPNINGMCDTS